MGLPSFASCMTAWMRRATCEEPNRAAAPVEFAQAAINSGVTWLPADSSEIHETGYQPSNIRHPANAGTAPCPPSPAQRYCARPPFAMDRLRKEGSDLVYRCAKQHSEPNSDKRGAKADELNLTPLELIDRLAALVPPPRTHRHHFFLVCWHRTLQSGRRSQHWPRAQRCNSYP